MAGGCPGTSRGPDRCGRALSVLVSPWCQQHDTGFGSPSKIRRQPRGLASAGAWCRVPDPDRSEEGLLTVVEAAMAVAHGVSGPEWDEQGVHTGGSAIHGRSGRDRGLIQ